MRQRVVTSFVLLGIGCFVIFFGGLYLYLFVSILSFLCMYELFAMITPKLSRQWVVLGYVLLAGIILTLLPVALYLRPLSDQIFGVWQSIPVKYLTLFLLALYFFEVFRHKLLLPTHGFLIVLRFIVFLSTTFPFIFLLRSGQNGLSNLLFCCVLIWAGDVCALFGGMRFGRHPLSVISPKKTVEGAICGVLGSLASAAILIWLLSLPSAGVYMLLALVIALVAQIGDLHESLTKRYFKVKDSSCFLPGHGGVYDRADSTLFVVPLLFYFFNG